jgi:para-aminobenzoate synthetase component I
MNPNDIKSYFSVSKKILEFSNLHFGRVYYKDHYLDLETGERASFSFSELKAYLKKLEVVNEVSKTPKVFHFFYELGGLIYGDDELVSPDDIILIEIHYKDVIEFIPTPTNRSFAMNEVLGPSRKVYDDSFARGYKKLLEGECYQFNLTFPFEFSYSKSKKTEDWINDFFSKKDSLGAFAHASIIPALEKIYISNSPESLFQVYRFNKGPLIQSMPIKGSMEIKKGDNLNDLWDRLMGHTKDEAELNMITDLLRNDLSVVSSEYAHVVAKKKCLVVPGILHQYSVIQAPLKVETSLFDLVSALFPGGSVTGAPKRNVIKILRDLEVAPRGFYCGSTTLLYGNIVAGSINIRSAVVNTNTKVLIYCAGGGITLNSQKKLEFEEMHLKVKSFTHLFE